MPSSWQSPDQAHDLSRNDTDRMVRSANFVQVADWLNSYVVKNIPTRETPRSMDGR
jgi:hypothetical protein